MTTMRKMTVKSLGEELDILKERVKEIEVLKEKVKEIPVLKQTVKDLVNTIKNLEEGKINGRENKETTLQLLKCRKCESIFENRKELKKHVSSEHVTAIKCKSCERIFPTKYELEVHIKHEHSTTEKYHCDFCDKTFVLKWRMLMHMKNHSNKVTKKCHYYNNNLMCPFEEMGCMFIHEESSLCRFDGKCTKRLCSYKHRDVIERQNSTNAVVDDKEESVSFQDENYWDESKNKNKSSLFQTSTPKKNDDQCEDCANQSECVDCIVKRFRGKHGGVTTAPRTPALGCSELGSSSWSTSDSSGGASSS